MNHDQDGWLTTSEGEELARLATGRLVLEVGCWCARSTIWLASTAQHVVSIDWFRGDAFAGWRATMEIARRNLVQACVMDRVTLVVGDVFRVMPWVTWCIPDLVFVDGDHSPEFTRGVLDGLARQTRMPVIAVHDYGHPLEKFRPADRVVDAFREREGLAMRLVDTLAILTRPAPIGHSRPA
jgi:predicted O-methyltransferase YrrM